MKTPGLLTNVKALVSIIGMRQRRAFGLLLVLTLVSASVQAVTVGALPFLAQAFQEPQTLAQYAWFTWARDFLGVTGMSDLALFLVVFTGLFILSKGLVTGEAYWRSRVVRDFDVDIGERLFFAYTNAPYTHHVGWNSSHIVRNLSQEVQRTVSAFMNLSQVVTNGVNVLVIFGLLFYMEPLISLLVLAIVGGGAGGIMQVVRRASNRLGTRVQRHMGRMVKAINQTIGGIREIRLLGQEAGFFSHFANSRRETAIARHRQRILKALLRPALEVLGVASLGLVILVVVLDGGSVRGALPTLALFVGAFTRVLPATTVVTRGLSGFYFKSVAARLVAEELERLRGTDRLAPVAFAERSHDTLPFREGITVSGVSFSYGPDQPRALDRVSLEIGKGQVIGLVGRTGSGKSTLVDILLGLLEPDDGRVTVDGRDIFRDLDRWRNMVGIVPQSVYLTDDTIRRNIAFGVSDHAIDEEAVQEAVRLAHLTNMVEGMPQGLKTRVGERGVRLSGGERQRVGLARALYFRPQVLILDEGTSALDNATEQALKENIFSLRAQHTIIQVAHRLTTVEASDIIYVFQEGQIVASGAYDDLVRNSDEFRALANADTLPEHVESLTPNTNGL